MEGEIATGLYDDPVVPGILGHEFELTPPEGDLTGRRHRQVGFHDVGVVHLDVLGGVHYPIGVHGDRGSLGITREEVTSRENDEKGQYGCYVQ